MRRTGRLHALGLRRGGRSVIGRSRLARQRWSLAVSATVVTVGLALAVALLIAAAEDFLPRAPGLDYRVIQAGLVMLAIAFSAYVIDRERSLRRTEHRLEDERREAERLRAVDEMKNAFLRSLSHDLRTPLTVILGMAQLLDRRGEEMPAERLRDAAQRISSQARRLDSMLTDLLDLERAARGMVHLQAREIDLAEVARRVVGSLDVVERQVEVPMEPLIVRADETIFERITDNLVRNAMKYTPHGTPIWVRLGPTKRGVLLTVSDAGPGVPDALKQAIFELFSRGEAVEGVTGTGVGLSLVRQFAELHGGRAWMEDRPGGGASFRVELAEAAADESAK